MTQEQQENAGEDEPVCRGRTMASRLRCVLYILIILIAPPIIYLGFGRNMRFFEVPSESMVPTLLPGDYLITLNEKSYSRGDIVVLWDPENKDSYIVKRVIATEGDTVAVFMGGLFLNGKYVPEPYIRERMNYILDPLIVPKESLLLLGDNRNESDDSSRWNLAPELFPSSEDWGSNGLKRCVDVKSIIGKVRCRYLPLARRGPIESYPLTTDTSGLSPETFAFHETRAMDFFGQAILGEKVDWREAAQAWQEARQYAGDTKEAVETWINEAQAWMRMDDVGQAQNCLMEALRIDPENELLRSILGGHGG